MAQLCVFLLYLLTTVFIAQCIFGSQMQSSCQNGVCITCVNGGCFRSTSRGYGAWNYGSGFGQSQSQYGGGSGWNSQQQQCVNGICTSVYSTNGNRRITNYNNYQTRLRQWQQKQKQLRQRQRQYQYAYGK